MIISFLLDGLLSKYLMCPYFTFINLLVISLYKNEDIVLKESLIFGILFDIVYTDTLIINGLLYFFLILLFNRIRNNNKYDIYLIPIIFIFYLFLIYFIYMLISKKFYFDFYNFLNIILINVIYFVILFIIKHKKILASYK